jgi:hypothetical protein
MPGQLTLSDGFLSLLNALQDVSPDQRAEFERKIGIPPGEEIRVSSKCCTGFDFVTSFLSSFAGTYHSVARYTSSLV